MPKPLLPPRSDFVFKRIFGDERNLDILMDFLQSVLTIPHDEYAEVMLADTNLNKDYDSGKNGILDVKIRTTNGKLIDVEIQRKSVPNVQERILFYTSKMFLEQIGEGDDYSKIKQVITIFITDYKLYEDTAYHHWFHLNDVVHGIRFSELLEVNTLELTKLPKDTDQTNLYNWLKFIKVETREELNMLATANPQINKAKTVLLRMSEDENARHLYDSIQLKEMDNQVLMKQAVTQGITQGIGIGKAQGISEATLQFARNMLDDNEPLEKIARFTKLSYSEIESLRLQ